MYISNKLFNFAIKSYILDVIYKYNFFLSIIKYYSVSLKKILQEINANQGKQTNVLAIFYFTEYDFL